MSVYAGIGVCGGGRGGGVLAGSLNSVDSFSPAPLNSVFLTQPMHS